MTTPPDSTPPVEPDVTGPESEVGAAEPVTQVEADAVEAVQSEAAAQNPSMSPTVESQSSDGADADAAQADSEPASGATTETSSEQETPEAHSAEPATEADVAPAAEAGAVPAETTTDTQAAPAGEATAPAGETAVPSSEAAAPKATSAAPPTAASPPLPKPVPKPRPIPKPSALAPAQPSVQAPPAPVVIDDEKATAEAASFGRVDDEGNVYVQEAAGERLVGQVPGAQGLEAMSLYIRRYLELDSRAKLLAIRLDAADVKAGQVATALEALVAEAAEPAAVGDLDGLRARLTELGSKLAERKEAEAAERAQARAQALADRTAIVEQAEQLASGDPARIHWKRTGEQLRALLEEWKASQRAVRLDKTTEDELWQRFTGARSLFERNRRAHFSQVDADAADAKQAKTAIVEEAEALASSTEWGPTAGKYRDLMARWKASGRAGRKDEDELWARFRAAQDQFFAARAAANQATDAEYQANLEVKLELLKAAEALVPVKDLDSAKAALRDLQDKWEAAGRVPRDALSSVEGRMRAVETAIRDAEAKKWRASDPEKQARADGAVAQLEAAIQALNADLAAAQAAGDKRKIKEVEASLAARTSWLEQIKKSAAQGL